MSLDGVARHLARVHHVVEDDQPSLVVLSRIRKETEVSAQRVGCGEVPYRAAPVDIDLRWSNGSDITVKCAAQISNAIFRARRRRSEKRHGECEEQSCDPAAAASHRICPARN